MKIGPDSTSTVVSMAALLAASGAAALAQPPEPGREAAVRFSFETCCRSCHAAPELAGPLALGPEERCRAELLRFLALSGRSRRAGRGGRGRPARARRVTAQICLPSLVAQTSCMKMLDGSVSLWI